MLASLALVTLASASFAVVTAPAAIVAANEPVPVPVTSPVSAMVWSPELVPETVAAEGTVIDEAIAKKLVKAKIDKVPIMPFVGTKIVFSLPGSEKAVRLGAKELIAPVLAHAVDLANGRTKHK